MCLIKAISTFDPSKSKFSYWATKIIRNGILKEIRKNKLEPAICFDESEHPSSGECDMPLDLIPVLTKCSDQDTPSDVENRRMLVRHFLEGVSMAEIAREVGFTREGVRQKVKKAIESIREKHGNMLDNHPFWLTTWGKSS
jgi:RNA polymerase sigma factor (sigma-70 family)